MKGLKYILAGGLLLTLPSCSHDWLNVEPSTSVETASSINVLSDVEFTLNGIYSIMQDADAYSGRCVYYGDATGDDMMAASSTKRTGNFYLFNWTRDSSPSSFWYYLYKMITNCNLILNNLDKVAVADDDMDVLNDFKGQTLAIRALAYFDLTRVYGYPYTKDQGASLAVPLVLTPMDYNAKPARATVAQCYEQIIKDLTEAIDLLEPDFNKGKINRSAAKSLLSRVYLYKGADELALTTAKDAIKDAEEEGYALWTNEEYPTAWGVDISASNPGEVLFEIVNETTDSPGHESLGYLHYKWGYADICITASFYKFLQEDPKDVRNQLLDYYEYDEDGELSDEKTFYLNKYQPQPTEGNHDANVPLIRLSETYLIAAEAAVKTGNNADAVKYLDAIVSRANPEKTVQGQTITLDQVLNERRKELVGEGHRMFDAIRNGQKIVRVDVDTDGLIDIEHDTEYMEYDWDFYKIVLPIPVHEMDCNKNIKQNPGY